MLLKNILALFRPRPVGEIVFVANKYANMIGMYGKWKFKCDKRGLPLLDSATQKAKYEMANGKYSIYFEKMIVK